jgi:predicted phage terminase large subunit-like protein
MRRIDKPEDVINHMPESKRQILLAAMQQPQILIREINNRSFFEFLKFFWPEVSGQTFVSNWHIKYICDELQKVAERVAKGLPREYDLIINVPPGSTKTVICSIMFPAWCWTQWYWMRFITISYSSDLSLESAEYSRDLIQSERYKLIYPDLEIKDDKNTKSNFRIVKKEHVKAGFPVRILKGGNRFSTSVTGTITGFHAHMLIWDDIIDPKKSLSAVELNNANHFLDETLPTRKVDKAVSTTIGIMQRLHQDDPTGHLLAKGKENIKHICLPGEIDNYRDKVNPPELLEFYKDNLLDPVRLPHSVLADLEADLGQYGYAGQIGQHPTPPAGGMFKVDNFGMIQAMPEPDTIVETVRYWDKAGTKVKVGIKGKAAYTVGVKMCRLRNGRWVILNVKRGRWSPEEREKIIRNTAIDDGVDVRIFYEQEPGSGGKESAQATTLNLAGYTGQAERPQGDKVFRADPYSVQVNDGNISLLQADWNKDFLEEHAYFPFGSYKDQVDAAGAAFAQLTVRREARMLTRRR